MKPPRWLLVFVLFILVGCPRMAENDSNRVLMETSLGSITLELNAAKAPVSVENFLKYVNAGFYDGTIFHRLEKDFVLQGGGFDANLRWKPTRSPIKNEADNGLENLRGTIAMARTNQIDSATSQFFINLSDNPHLNHYSPDIRGYGYAVFGKVVEGMDVVDRIAGQKTVNRGGAFAKLPQPPVEILRVNRIN